MNLSDQGHPHLEQLTQYQLGKLADEQTAEIEEHVAACEECARTIAGISGDTFVQSLRRKEAAGGQGTHSDLPLRHEQETRLHNAGSTTLSEELESAADAGFPPELASHSRYQILERLGEGGMGSVYKAQHRIMNRLVALKVIHPQFLNHSGATERFHREMRAAARLNHPNIVTSHDADQAERLHFLVMEYVDGVNLHQLVQQRGALPTAEACEYIRQAALGLQHAHEQGMVHRDIKPHNLMLVGQASDTPGSERSLGGRDVPAMIKILDFGLASLVSETLEEDSPDEHLKPANGSSQLTMAGAIMGTPDYTAPEQTSDAHSVDIRADIYSLGCTFYCLLAGRAPFDEVPMLDKIFAHAESVAAAVSSFRDDVPVEVEQIVGRMMAKDPDQRYQTPIEVAEDIADVRALLAPSEAPTEASVLQEVRFPPRRWFPLVATALAGFSSITVAGIVVVADRYNHPQRDLQQALDTVGQPLVGPAIDDVDGGAKLAVDDTPSNEITEVRRFEGHDSGSPRSALAVFANGEQFLSGGGNDRTARVWNMAAAKPTHTLVGHAAPVTCVAVAPDAQFAATADYAGEIRIWQPGTWQLVDSLRVGPHEVADGNSLADPRTESVACLSFSPDGRLLAASSNADMGRFYVWDIVDRKLVAQMEAQIFSWQVAFLPDSKTLAIASSPACYLWDTTSHRLDRKLESAGAIRCLCLSQDASLMVGGLEHGRPAVQSILVWDVATGREVQRFDGHDSYIVSVRFLPGERYLVSGSVDGTIRVWDRHAGRQVAQRDNLGHLAHCVAPLPDGRHLLSTGRWNKDHAAPFAGDHAIRLWRLPERLALSSPPSGNASTFEADRPGGQEAGNL